MCGCGGDRRELRDGCRRRRHRRASEEVGVHRRDGSWCRCLHEDAQAQPRAHRLLPGRKRRRNQGRRLHRRHRHGVRRRQVFERADSRGRRQGDKDGRAPDERRHGCRDVRGRSEGLCVRPRRVRLPQEPAVVGTLHVLSRRPGRPPADERRQGGRRTSLEGRQFRLLHRLPERRPADLRAQRRDGRAQARVQPQGGAIPSSTSSPAGATPGSPTPGRRARGSRRGVPTVRRSPMSPTRRATRRSTSSMSRRRRSAALPRRVRRTSTRTGAPTAASPTSPSGAGLPRSR